MSKQSGYNATYREQNNLVRYELLLSELTRIRFKKLLAAYPHTADDLLSELIDTYNLTRISVQEDQAVQEENLTRISVQEDQAVQEENLTRISVQAVQELKKEEVKALAMQLLQKHGMDKRAALTELSGPWHTQHPAWKNSCKSTPNGHEYYFIQKQYNRMHDAMAAIIKKLPLK